jgi:methionyl-tRNA formyltransferase
VTSPPAPPRRIAYLGSPDLAVPPLRALVDAGLDVALVVTQPDRRRRRGGKDDPTPVKAAAVDLGIPVSHDVADVVDANVDLGVVVAFGRIIPVDVLDAVAMVNIHFSLLPRWRGAAPLERAILAGDEMTGVCLMDVEETLDTGGVYARREVPIGPHATLEDLRGDLVEAACEMLVTELRAGLGEPEPQSGEVTWAEKIRPEDFEIDWRRSAVEAERIVRLGRAWTTWRGSRLGVVSAMARAVDEVEGRTLAPGEVRGVAVGTGQGVLVLAEVKPEGRRAVDAAGWVNGARLEPGEMLGT